MGAQNTKSSSSHGHLNQEEVEHLKITFGKVKMHDLYSSNPTICSSKTFQLFFKQQGLDPYLSQRCTSIITSEHKGVAEKAVGLKDFILFVSTILKGDLDEKVTAIARICKNSKTGENGTVKEEEILEYASSIIDSYVNCVKDLPSTRSWANAMHPTTTDSKNSLASYILRDVFYPDSKSSLAKLVSGATGSSFTLDALITGISKSVLFQNLHNSVWGYVFDLNKPKHSLIAHCLKASTALTPVAFSILDYHSLVFLNSQLPSDLREEWRLLFSTSIHGESYASMYKRIKDKGSTLIILKTGDNWIFGGFATDSWSFSPKFYGDSRSFLFHLFPIFETYPATGYNKNFQYFNIDQKTLPNGLGMGGTLEYFGLWIDSEFGYGKTSPSCTTYSCPQLSKDQEFKIVHLEVWGVGPEPEKEEGVRDSKSILDQNPEAKAVLEIMGKNVTASDGYRDNNPVEDE